MKLLLTNDDGIDAPGLEALLAAATSLGDPVVVAPFEGQSGCGHRVTTGQWLRLDPRATGLFAVSGTPGDCVRLALHQITPDADWVLAGINHGGNLGADIHHSGTVAAVREAALHGKPGVAVSHFIKKDLPLDWPRASTWITPILSDLLCRPHLPGSFWSINLPHLEPDAPDPQVVFCPLDPSPLPLCFRQDGDLWHYAGDYHARKRRPGADVDVCFRGMIAVTRLSLG
jgi:5'-nucleotidase